LAATIVVSWNTDIFLAVVFMYQSPFVRWIFSRP